MEDSIDIQPRSTIVILSRHRDAVGNRVFGLLLGDCARMLLVWSGLVWWPDTSGSGFVGGFRLEV